MIADSASSGSAREYDVVVIGAGQAGLAIGYHLARSDLRFVIFEAGDAVGAAWADRWDSLTLFTPRRYDSLPGLPFPGDPDGYPGRDEVLAYLGRYADTFGLPVQLGSMVVSVEAVGAAFRVVLRDGSIVTADQVVVTTGPYQVPYVPELAARLAPDVVQLHSTGYRAPGGLPAGAVLVVGGGNTGFQIAEELAASRDVHLSIGSRQLALPQRLLGRDLFWWLTKLGLLKKTVDSRLGRRFSTRGSPLIGSSARRIRRLGVRLRPRVTDASGRAVRFEDGSELEVDVVIWATGYRTDHSWITPSATRDQGPLRHRRGVTELPGLYFLGLEWQYTRGSALLGWVKDDAAFIADRIEARAELREAPRPELAERM